MSRESRDDSRRESSFVPRDETSAELFVPADMTSVSMRHDSSVTRKRLLRRDQEFHQSSGRVYMSRSGYKNSGLRALFVRDSYHVMLTMPTSAILAIFFMLYTLVIIVFAGAYMAIDGKESACGLAARGTALDFHTAFSFSLETMTTIGYGIPHDTGTFFAGCWLVPATVHVQAMIFLMMNAAFVGLIFVRIGRANTRSAQIIFSDKAVVRCDRGRFYLFFQIGEASFLHYEPIVEAHVRAYAVLHELRQRAGEPRAAEAAAGPQGTRAASVTAEVACDGNVYQRALFQTRVVRLTNPNDELGGMLFLATPQCVSHNIDRWSPLYPPAALMRAQQLYGRGRHFPGLVLRENDFTAQEQWEEELDRRKRRGLAEESGSAKPPKAKCSEAGSSKPSASESAPESAPAGDEDRSHLEAFRDAIKRHVRTSELELIIIVEAIDPYSSNTFQARHSYTSDDILFDYKHEPCMSLLDGQAHLDWSKFHSVTPVPFNAKNLVASSHS